MRYQKKLSNRFQTSGRYQQKYDRRGRQLRPTLITLAALLIVTTFFIKPADTFAKSCDDVKFIFARGSGEPLSGPSFQAWHDSLERALRNTSLQYDFYELGATSQQGYRYPAISVSGSLGGFGNLLGAYLSRGQFFDFAESVTQGSGELKAYIRIMSAACPQTKFVLGGYSQGAMVLSRTLDELDSNRIIYVATFGDPKLYLPEGKGTIPPACLGKEYSEYRAHVPDCRAYEGILGSYRPYEPEGYADKLGTWCNTKDIMCSSVASVEDHTSYTTEGLYSGAARKVKTRLKRAFPQAFANTPARPWANSAHNVVFLIDATISMGLYRRYVERAKTLTEQILDNGGAVAIADYRDLLEDSYEPHIDCDFGCTQAEVESTLSSFDFSGGGDAPESALSAMKYVLDNLNWEAGAAKSIVLITDSDYHSPDHDGTTPDEVIQRSLEIDPVNIYTISPEEYRKVYKEVTSKTGGATFRITQHDLWQDLGNRLLYRPEATLGAVEYSGLVGDEFHFDAGDSKASDGGALKYDWDLDGDGEYEILDGPAMITKTYASAFSGYIQVGVTDSEGRFANMSARLSVSDALPLIPSINNLSAQELDAETYQINYETNAERVLVSIDDSPAGYLDGSARNFTINDIQYATRIRLTPYSPGIGRGKNVEVTIGHGAAPNPSLLPPAVTPDRNPSTAERPKSTSDKKTTAIPKAPNTGIRPVPTTSMSY